MGAAMANGFTNEQMLEMILDRLDRVDDKQNSMLAEISSLNSNGCAHRHDDLERIRELESWRTRGIIGVITLFVGMIVEFIRK